MLAGNVGTTFWAKRFVRFVSIIQVLFFQSKYKKKIGKGDVKRENEKSREEI